MMGALEGLTIVELAGIGPAPHAVMALSDLGATVTRVVRPGAEGVNSHTLRGRQHVVGLDLKSPQGREEALQLIAEADVLVEGFRPQVTERLGLGPAACMSVNPRLIYARVTGWGQDGPQALMAGHDINYLSLTGVLEAIGTPETPVPPLNLVADNGGGSMFAVVGILAALWRRERLDCGQVIDAAMVDGVTVLAQQVLELQAQGKWGVDGRGTNILDGGAPFYRTYRCRDGKFLAVGSIEPQFYSLLLAGLGFDQAVLPDRDDRENWPRLAQMFADRIAERKRDEWAEHFAGTDACVTPVLTFAEACEHPHIRARGSLTSSPDGLTAGTAPQILPVRVGDTHPTVASAMGNNRC